MNDGSVDDLVVRRFVVEILEVRDLQSADRVDGGAQRILGPAGVALFAQLAAGVTQHAQDLCAVVSLAFTMLAEAHVTLAISSLDHTRYRSLGALSHSMAMTA